MNGPLAGFRILEHSGDVATRYCGRLFAAWGGEVTRVVAADDGRLGYAEEAGRAYGAWLDQDKTLVAGAGQAAGPFDLIIAGQDRAALDAAEAFRDARGERGALLSLSWFDPDGPYGDWRGTDEIIQALCGVAFGFGEADGPPMLAQGHAPQVIGGLVAYNAALGVLLAAQGRRPDRIAVNILEANLCFTEPGAVAAHADGTVATRLGPNRFSPLYPAAAYRTADGWVGITCLTPAQWASLCRLVGRPEAADDPRFATSLERVMLADEIDALLAPAFPARTTAEWVALGDRHRIPTAPMPTPGQMPDEPHWAARGAFAQIGGTSVRGPTLPYRMSFDGVAAPRWSGYPAPGPLAGLRVVDFSMGWAGPLCARTLADLGAEVVKIESADHPDWWRGWDDNEADRAAMEMKHNFLGANRNKLGVCIDLTRPEGVAQAKALIARADVVVENYAAGVLEKLGLGPAVQRALKPGVISLTMPAFGASGPLAGLRAYGSTVEQACGLPFVNGEAHWPPVLQHVAFGDPTAGLYAASAILTALAGRERLGGADIDLAQVACLFQLGADSIIAAQVLGEPLPRTGHERPRLVLCAVVATSDRWLAVAADDASRSALATVVGDPSKTALATWASGQTADGAAARLQAAGVPAAPVQRIEDLVGDPQLSAGEYWVALDRAVIGRHLVPATPFRYDGARPAIRQPAPTLGQHTEIVLAGLGGPIEEVAA
jgi:crotonobetainyl-CoA:carnitine CoA-transferase CaiB-like acyl-CoA transferase